MRMSMLLCARSLALAGFAFLTGVCAGAPAAAQTCGTDYTVKEGESLGDIAARVYGSSSQWTLIFYANQDRMGANASMLAPGLAIRIPCVSGAQQPASAASPAAAVLAPSTPAPQPNAIELSSEVKRIEFLTAGGNAPFTDPSLPGGGMIAQLVSASMDIVKDQSGGKFGYNISWVNDWGAHLNPLLITRAFDAGFPWLKPDCSQPAELSADAKYRCQKFFFSEPLYEVFTVLFVKADSSITFANDSDMHGKTLCRPAGFSTYELDKGGRNWVKDNKVVLMRPQTIEECFRLLDSGSVQAVVTSDLTGQSVSTALGMTGRVKQLQRPVAIGTMHVIVPKTHPHASTVLYYVNTAIGRLRESGEYDKIVEANLARFWNGQEQK